MHHALLGQAGTGKSYTIKQLLKNDPDYGIKTASTGIAAVNLQDESGSASTINSTLGFFDTRELLFQTLKPGRIDEKINDLANKYKYLILDEISMVEAAQLDLIYRVTERVNQDRMDRGLSSIYLKLVGDFGQLPPVNGKPAFLAKCWNQFDVQYLTEVKRQDETDFINALTHVRNGEAREALPYFESLGFNYKLDKDFKGSTFMSKNADVNRFNKEKLDNLPGRNIYIDSFRRGKEKPEWKHIPESLRLKEGTLVVILMNSSKAGYVNGDLAYVEKVNNDDSVDVTLQRDGRTVTVERVTIYNKDSSDITLGSLNYMPLRVAYALTVHKSQGLTLDNVQVLMGDSFMSRCHGMFYVALSRARKSKGLRLVGSKDDFLRSPFFGSVYREFIK